MKNAITAVQTALTKHWFAALLVAALGLVLGIAVGAGKFNLVPPAFLATASVQVGTYVVTGVSMPCAATAVPTVAKSDAVVGATKGAQAWRVTATPVGTDAVQVHYVATTEADAMRLATDLATNLASACRTQTIAAYEHYNLFLADQKELRQSEMRQMDAVLLPASNADTSKTNLQKQQSDAQTKATTADAQAGAANATASAKKQAQNTAVPAAQNANAQSDAAYKAMQTQLTADQAQLSTMQAKYKSGYSALTALQHKVTAEQQQLAAYKKQLDEQLPLTLDPTYRAAQDAADSAQASADDANAQATAANTALDKVNQQLAKSPSRTTSQQTYLAMLTRHKAELLKDYQNLSAQFNTALTQEGVIPVVGPVVLASSATDAVNVQVLLDALLGLLVFVVFALLAIGLALLLDLADRRLLTLEAITKLYGKPVIATLKPKR
ncbi:MAG: hypothetical protein JO103_02675 [Candidatus Eremiobacteraeota bacterium]|nr:hypothetical protein [Candidatus Eremiobacteraeota bacterium]